jgi:drug/metabolite transporter (DMT)-like permease
MSAATASSQRGIVLMLLTMAVFSAMDTVTKLLAPDYSAPQILWVRFVFFFLFALATAGRRGPLRTLRSARPRLQIARSLVLLAEMGVFILALRYLPLADVIAIASATPLIVTALAVPVLGERVGARRWAAVIVGFAGVLVIVRPGFAEGSALTLIPVLGATMWAIYQLMVRRLAASDSADTTVLYTATVGLVVLSCIGPFFWQPPDARGWLLLGLVAVLGATGHGLLIRALQAADATVLQPFAYAHLVGATLFGFVVFGDVPDRWTVAGALLVVGCGLFVAYRERALRRAAAPLTPPRPAGR